MSDLPAGRQHELVLGTGASAVRAVVVELAASLRELTVAGVDLVQSYPDDIPPPMAAGTVLVPWPNRVDGGRWRLHGVEQQLEITEPERGNAVHGLLSSTRYQPVARHDHSITLSTPVRSQPGYPLSLDTSVTYELVPDGVRVQHDIHNAGTSVAPVAIGAHPYLRVGTARIEDLTVTVPARRVLQLDERYIPRGSIDVAGTGSDLRAGVLIRDVVGHACFAELDVVDGLITSTLSAPDGRTLEIWAEPDFAYIQFYVAQGFPGVDGPTTAVAIEPMTAPPNALQSGESLRWLEPGETWSPDWGLRLRGA